MSRAAPPALHRSIPALSPAQLWERFGDRLDKSSGCWLYTGFLYKGGYAKVSVSGPCPIPPAGVVDVSRPDPAWALRAP